MPAPQQLEAGRTAFAEKRYEDAIQSFSKALSLSKGAVKTQLVVLDLRCQAYSKLGKLDLALQDARHMIHTNRCESTGYLRCSQIESISKNHTAAIRWLEHGIKQVPNGRQVFENRLAKVKQAASTYTILSKRQDPVVSMPLDVLHIILSYLKYREIVILLRVSKTWRNLLQTIPPITTEIDFSGTSKRVSRQACKASLQRLCRHARKLDFNLLSAPAVELVHHWLSKFPHLETLEVLHLDRTEVRLDVHIRWRSFAKLKSLHVGGGQRLSSNKMNEIIASCQSLQEVTMCVGKAERRYSTQTAVQTQLRHLHIYGEDDIPFTVEPEFCHAYPNLKSLSLIDGEIVGDVLEFTSLQTLEKLVLALRSPNGLELSLPWSLKDLNIVEKLHCQVAYTFTQPISLPNLCSVSLQNEWGQYLIDALENTHNPSKPQSVRTSNIGQAFWNLKSSQGCCIFEPCRELSFQSDDLSDRDSAVFISLYPNVEVLQLEAPHITGAFLADLMNSPSCCLRQVMLKDCHKISSDISFWLKSKGVKCRVTNSTTDSNSIRRVRDMW